MKSVEGFSTARKRPRSAFFSPRSDLSVSLPECGSPVPEREERRSVRWESNQRFWVFCLLGGWLFTYGLSPLGQIPSLGAAVEKGGAVWMLGVMLGLRAALQRGDVKSAAIWTSALMVYPILMLLLGGFLSYGAAAVIIVGAIAAVSTVRSWRVIIIAVVVTYVGLSVFVNYFHHRNEIRDAVWGGAPMGQRIDASLGIFRDFEWFDSSNPVHLTALHKRLNQNYFVGLAAQRIEEGQVDYLYGRSVWEGLLSLVPRALWPDKPVFGGSPKIVMEMTGLVLDEDTSWGVGNVMEFQINFGIPGLVVGFLILGWLLGTLDRKAAEAERAGELGRVFFFFLPAAALIQPIGSIVELTGGAAAALVAAYGWSWGWERWSRRGVRSAKMPVRVIRVARAAAALIGPDYYLSSRHSIRKSMPLAAFRARCTGALQSVQTTAPPRGTEVARFWCRSWLIWATSNVALSEAFAGPQM